MEEQYKLILDFLVKNYKRDFHLDLFELNRFHINNTDYISIFDNLLEGYFIFIYIDNFPFPKRYIKLDEQFTLEYLKENLVRLKIDFKQ